MAAPVCKLSIVCPAFEEEEVLPHFHAELCAALAPLEPEYEVEILYIDDGSRDGTLDFLRLLAATDPRIRYLSFSRNFGQQAALTAGMEHARGDVVITLDSDLQHPPNLIPALLDQWRKGHDIVLTFREDDPRLSYFKRVSSRAFNTVMHWLSDTPVSSAASDYRLLSRKAVDSLLRLHEKHRFLRGMVNWLGFPTTTVAFYPASRGAGVTKYTLRRMLALAIDAMLSFSKLPLRLSMVLGILLVVLGSGCGILLLGQSLFGGSIGGYQIVLMALFLVGGAILCCLGIVGEYIGRIYEQVKVRPLYLLKEASPELAALPLGLEGVTRNGYPDRAGRDASAA
ncbi:MAG TPA: glycosyltransferase family 2 protein [Gemmataceae bacterium]|nr:glycosyltransferase family 2 protein [Gemmataceae bacterium]